MGRRKKSVETDQDIRLRPTLSPEALENRQIFLANRLAEQKLLDGTASSQLIVHFLKLGTTKNQLEIEKLRAETAKANAQAEAMLKRLGNPSRFGYPVFVVLNSKGDVLHIQDSSFLEEGQGYSKDKVIRFFKNWTPQAVESGK